MSESTVQAGGANARKKEDRKGLFARIALFVRQVVAELKKVVSPTRQELLTYTGVVLVFVAIVMAFVGLLDYVIGLGVIKLLG